MRVFVAGGRRRSWTVSRSRASGVLAEEAGADDLLLDRRAADVALPLAAVRAQRAAAAVDVLRRVDRRLDRALPVGRPRARARSRARSGTRRPARTTVQVGCVPARDSVPAGMLRATSSLADQRGRRRSRRRGRRRRARRRAIASRGDGAPPAAGARRGLRRPRLSSASPSSVEAGSVIGRSPFRCRVGCAGSLRPRWTRRRAAARRRAERGGDRRRSRGRRPTRSRIASRWPSGSSATASSSPSSHDSSGSTAAGSAVEPLEHRRAARTRSARAARRTDDEQHVARDPEEPRHRRAAAPSRKRRRDEPRLGERLRRQVVRRVDVAAAAQVVAVHALGVSVVELAERVCVRRAARSSSASVLKGASWSSIGELREAPAALHEDYRCSASFAAKRTAGVSSSAGFLFAPRRPRASRRRPRAARRAAPRSRRRGTRPPTRRRARRAATCPPPSPSRAG